MIETSETTAKLDAALAKAQGEIEAASKDKVNPAFRSKYADLTSVWAAIRPVLSKHGIAVTQWPVHSDDNRLHIVTRLAHDGEWIRARFSIPVVKQDPHGYGSATTYAKRFSLAACVGVVADDDDDGNAAANKPAMPSVAGTVGASKAGSRTAYDAFVKAIRSAATIKALADWHKENVTEIDKLPQDWIDQLREEYTDRQAELKKALAA
jgi:hypothetical protein